MRTSPLRFLTLNYANASSLRRAVCDPYTPSMLAEGGSGRAEGKCKGTGGGRHETKDVCIPVGIMILSSQSFHIPPESNARHGEKPPL